MAQANIKAVITAQDNASATLNKFGNRVSSIGSKIASTMKVAAVATAAVGGAVIVKNLDNAIKRVDTLSNSTRVFAAMGFGVKEVGSAMKALDESIRGLPTTLDSAVKNVQLLAGATNDIGKSQKIFSALNNAIIGFGGTAEDVSNSVIQLSEAFAGGVVDSNAWQSLIQNGLGPALNALARDLGLTIGELKDGLAEGSISVEDFQNALINMDKKGGGGLKSFEKLAKEATGGIGTAWENMNTAITRSLAKIIQTIGQENISQFITNIGKSFENSTSTIIKFGESVVSLGRNVAEYLSPKLTALWNTISTKLLPALNNLWKNVIQPLVPVIGTALVVALGLATDALNVAIVAISSIIGWLSQHKEIVYGVITALATYKTVLLITAVANKFNLAVASMTNFLNIFRTQGLGRAIAQTKIFRALALLPISMPAIAIAAVIGSLAVVIAKAIETRRVFDELHRSINANSAIEESSIRELQRLRKQGTPAQQKRALKALQGIANNRGGGGGFATGGFTGRGNMNEVAGIVHRGEYVIPKEHVNQNTGLPKSTSSPNVHITIQAGAFMGSQQEARKYAEMIINAYNDLMASRGRTNALRA